MKAPDTIFVRDPQSKDIKLIRKIESGNRLVVDRKLQDALEVYFDVLNEMNNTEPSTDEMRDLLKSILFGSLFTAYFKLGNYREAIKWQEEELKCNIPKGTFSEIMNLGRAHYELGEFKEAYELFTEAYARAKYRAFQEYDQKYWKFFKTYSA
jgi:tetratricopeptide (TPR) repeat protein